MKRSLRMGHTCRAAYLISFFGDVLDRFIPLRRSPFIEEIFSFFYRGKRENNVEIPRGHRLALLLMYVFFP